jgi:hypothetical protein
VTNKLTYCMLAAAVLCALAVYSVSAQADVPRVQPGIRVVCIASFDPPEGLYRYKPRKCLLHQRHEFPIIGANTTPLKSMRWNVWNGREARGKGKYFITTYGPAPARVTLSQPRTLCGERVFSKVKIRYTVEVDGETTHGGGSFHPDTCLT